MEGLEQVQGSWGWGIRGQERGGGIGRGELK